MVFQVEATRRILLEDLPPVLILHLKWFIYNKMGGMQKHPKNFGFEEKLELHKGNKNSAVKMTCCP